MSAVTASVAPAPAPVDEAVQMPSAVSGCTDSAIGDLLAAEEMDDYSNDSDSDMDDQDEDGIECEESLMTGNTQPSQGQNTGNGGSQNDMGATDLQGCNDGAGNGTATSGLKASSQQHQNKEEAKRERLEKRRRSNRESARRMRQQRIQRLAKLQEELAGLRHTKQQLNSKQEMLARDYEAALAEHNALKQRLSQLQSKVRGTSGSMQVDVMAYTYPGSVAANGLTGPIRASTPKSMYHPSGAPQQRTPQHTADDSSLMFPTMKRPAPSGPLDGQPRPKRPMEGHLTMAQSPKESLSAGLPGSAHHAAGALPNTSPSLTTSPSIPRPGIPPQAPSSAPHRLEPPEDPSSMAAKHLNVRRQLLPPPTQTSQGMVYNRSMANDMLAGPNTPTRRATPPMPPSLMMSRAHSAPPNSARSSPYPSYTHDSTQPQPLPLRPQQRTSAGMVPSMAMAMPSPGTLSSTSMSINGRSPAPHTRMYNRPMDPNSQPSVPPTVRLQQGPSSNSPFPQSRFAAPSMVGNIGGVTRAHMPSPNPTRIPPTLSRAAARALMASQAMADHGLSSSTLPPPSGNAPYTSPRLDPNFSQNKLLPHRTPSAGSMMDDDFCASKPSRLPPHRSPNVGTLMDMRRLTPLPCSASPQHSAPAACDNSTHTGTLPAHTRMGSYNPMLARSPADPANNSKLGMPRSTGNLLDPLRPGPGLAGPLQRLPSQGERQSYSNMPSPTIPTQSSQNQPQAESAPHYQEWQDDPCDPFPMPMPGWSGMPPTSAPLPYPQQTGSTSNATPVDNMQLPLSDDLLTSALLPPAANELTPKLSPLPSTLDNSLNTKPEEIPPVTLQPLTNSPTVQNGDTSSPGGLPNMLSNLSGLPDLDMDFLGTDSFLDNLPLDDVVDEEAMRAFIDGVMPPSPMLGPKAGNQDRPDAGLGDNQSLGQGPEGNQGWHSMGQQQSGTADGHRSNTDALPACVSTPDTHAEEKSWVQY